jgi:phosphoribosylamine--glycine ligase/phosphoribosylaminoimidazole synthetase
MVNILVLGGGGREAAITDQLQFNDGHTVFRMNKWDDDILKFCKEKDINLVVPSSEEYLCKGIVDYFAEHAPDIKVFGPNKEQARIEGSKKFSKELMRELDIPTPNYDYYSCYRLSPDDPMDLFEYTPIVKYSGLARGKGVFTSPICGDVYRNLKKAFDLGDEGVLLEERIRGHEVSVLAFCNGSEAFLTPQVQDYKKMYDGDSDIRNPNTGGMGAVCPANILSDEEIELVKTQMDKVVNKLNYKGILYAGLMKTYFSGVYFLEFNCRFGDPETQVLMNLLESNLYDIMMDCLCSRKPTIKWSHQHAAAVVLSHVTYPTSVLDDPVKMTYGDIDSSIVIYKAGMIDIDDENYTKGGRVLAMVSKADELQTALENVYNNIHKIQYDGAYYRRDIGSNLIKEETHRKVAVGVLASGNGTSVGKLLSTRPGFVKVIITDREDAKIIEKAQYYHVPFVLIPQDGTPRAYYEKIVNILRTFEVELVILSGFMRIVPATLFDEFFTINIHPSLLPKYGSMMDMDIHNTVIENRDLFSGCTLHRVTKDVDEGRILMQKQYKLKQWEDGIKLKQAIQRLEGECILEYVDIYNRSKINYSVNIQEGNEFVNDLKKTLPKVGGFCSDVWTTDRGTLLVTTTDGIGTKLDLSIKYNKLDTIGIDLVAMNVNDLIAGGAEPIIFMDYIALDKMDKTKCNTIIRGIQKGCRIAGCELTGGETAEMKGIYMKNKLDLAGFAVGEIQHQLAGKEFMTEGNILYGIESSGIHSNGYTLVNKLLKRCDPLDCPSVDELLKPTRIYSDVYKLWSAGYNGYNYPSILGMAHITGGGFRDNLPRILPDHLTYDLVEWEFPDIFKWVQKESKLSREEMLATFNCGYGMVIVAESEIDSPILTYIGRLVNRKTRCI